MKRKITVAEMAPHVHSFSPDENKVQKIADWLINWIEASLKSGKITAGDFLPSKGELACHIGVSQGTMQSVYRLVEDFGLVVSRQRVGTSIKGETKTTEKFVSQRDFTIEFIKKYILENNYNPGDKFISARKLSEISGISNTTIITALASLLQTGVFRKEGKNFIVQKTDFEIEPIAIQTLVEKTASSLKQYIAGLNAGDRLPSNIQLAEMFNVSVKTIYDAVKLLSKEGLLHTRRGKYGTTVYTENQELYHYEKIEQKIRQYISDNCQVGDKLPSIKEFAKDYQTSEKTVKTALDNLAEDGFLTFSRGRYGGTFVMDIPQGANEAYKWLAINSEYILPE